LKCGRRWAEGRVKGCGRFKLLVRARRGGGMVDMVINWVVHHGECNNRKNEKLQEDKAEERRGRRGSKEGLSEFFLRTSF
jgi:hypothetical protein